MKKKGILILITLALIAGFLLVNGTVSAKTTNAPGDVSGAQCPTYSERSPEPGLLSDGSWITVLTLNPGQDVNGQCLEPYSSGTGYNGVPQWVHHAVDLSAYANKKIRVRFYFDTNDPLYNKFEGWYVDNIRVGALYDKGGPRNPYEWQIDGSHSDTAWHITMRRPLETLVWSWWYGNEALGTFQAGGNPTDCSDERNWGTLTSPFTLLGGYPYLHFDTLWQIESVDAQAYDMMRVQIQLETP